MLYHTMDVRWGSSLVHLEVIMRKPTRIANSSIGPLMLQVLIQHRALTAWHVVIYFILQHSSEIDHISIPMVQKRTWRHREVRQFALGHTACKLPGQTLKVSSGSYLASSPLGSLANCQHYMWFSWVWHLCSGLLFPHLHSEKTHAYVMLPGRRPVSLGQAQGPSSKYVQRPHN